VPLPRAAVAALSAQHQTSATIGFRPEATSLTTAEDGIPFEVTVVEELGSDAFAYGNFPGAQTEAGRDRLITVRIPGRKVPMKGETVHLQVVPEEIHVFNTETGKRIAV
jgi:multiple sugar transport system ATP-binding protein